MEKVLFGIVAGIFLAWLFVTLNESMKQRAIQRMQEPGIQNPLDKGGFKWRKLALYGAFAVLAVLFLFGEPLAHWLANLAYGANQQLPPLSKVTLALAAVGDSTSLAMVHRWDALNAANASTAQIAADAKVGGWVPVGTATSKIILAVSFYVVSYIIPWVVQQATHPGPTKWTKEHYTDEFDQLTSEVKFEVLRGMSYSQSLRIIGSFLAACLIQ